MDGTEHFDLSLYVFTGEAAEEARRIEETDAQRQRITPPSLWDTFAPVFEEELQ